jgi:IclR family acetate operon transcriptional repressor
MSVEMRRTRGRPRNPVTLAPAPNVQALDRALALLELVAGADGLTLTEISQRAGMAPSTAHRLLTTLEGRGFVQMLTTSGEWVVGVEAFRTGTAFLRRTKPADMGRTVMRDLMESCGETVNLGIAEDDVIVFISQVETHEAIRAFFRPGTRSPMHASGIGKALLAQLPEERVRRILQRTGLAKFTPRTLIDPKSLAADLAGVRRRGWAIDNEERTPGMRCVAAPIFNEYREAVAGISVSGPAVRMTDERLGELGPQVVRAADSITVSIGGQRPGGLEGES